MNTKNHDCIECAKKHLSKALVLSEEIPNGYEDTDHEIYLIGNLAEAESHLLAYPVLALSIRDIRKSISGKQSRDEFLSGIDKIKAIWMELKKIPHENTSTSNASLAPFASISPYPQIAEVAKSSTCVITPTGDRPIMLRILRKCLEAQSVKPDWIVVDDGISDSSPIVKGYPKLTYYRRQPNTSGINSIKEQMLEVFSRGVGYENIVIMEDDDWYSSDYIESMIDGLKHNKLVGIRPYMYYSVKTNSYMIRGQTKSMSIWATTAFKSDIIPDIIDIIKETKDHSIDINVWNKLGAKYGYVFEKDHMMHVGIKNAPGRSGTTGTHSKHSLGASDPDGSFLKKIVGEDYYRSYANLFKTMDIVLPLGTGSKYDNVESRMALRSIKSNFIQLGSIFVVCDELPSWMTNVIHVKCGDVSKSGKDAILINKVLEACKRTELSENFMFWSDDQVLVKPMFIDDVVPVAATMRIETMGDTKWNKRLKNTKLFLESKNKPTQNWESHVPQPYNKSKFVEVMSGIDYDVDIGYGINTLYFNMIDQKPSVLESQCKLTLEGGKLCCKGIPGAVQNKTWIGYNDNGLQNGLLDYLNKIFPKPSAFEKTSDSTIIPQTASMPKSLFNAIDIYNHKDKVLAHFPALSQYYDDIERKKLSNPSWRAGNLKRYIQPLVDEFIKQCDAIHKSPHSVLV